ncbi:hypothetical protein LMG28614_00772 [Paraburkholderia ultramafica]|uniref:Type II secretion system protein n=1 Tax=Paraburkholderia ultramafica TaxID=1544867 RepID=A0A6S7AVM7_9BURK|nr:hypothetical protein LMG28614_00772 [Paraburkholderia ultramafica]
METLQTMQVVLLIGLFAVVFACAFGAMLVFAPRDMRRRIEQAGGAKVAATAVSGGELPGSGWIEKLAEISEPISKLSIPKEGWDQSALRVRMMNAGWRTPAAAAVYFAAKTVLAIALPLLAMSWLVVLPGPAFIHIYRVLLPTMTGTAE